MDHCMDEFDCLGAVELLCELTHQQDPSLRLNGVWGLMNLSFNSEQRIKSHIMTTLGTDQVYNIMITLGTDQVYNIMITLGTDQIDNIMTTLGQIR